MVAWFGCNGDDCVPCCSRLVFLFWSTVAIQYFWPGMAYRQLSHCRHFFGVSGHFTVHKKSATKFSIDKIGYITAVVAIIGAARADYFCLGLCDYTDHRPVYSRVGNLVWDTAVDWSIYNSFAAIFINEARSLAWYRHNCSWCDYQPFANIG